MTSRYRESTASVLRSRLPWITTPPHAFPESPHRWTRCARLSRGGLVRDFTWRSLAGLHPDQARRQLREERHHLPPPQLPDGNDLAASVDAVNLEDALGKIQPDGGNLHVDGPSDDSSATITLWHSDAARGSRPHHQGRELGRINSVPARPHSPRPQHPFPQTYPRLPNLAHTHARPMRMRGRQPVATAGGA
jgi:hypothetical protein